jgi:nucleoid-associated protein YgaU
MKIRRFIPKQKLRATARRVARPAMEDFGDEPNMSFAKALIVVVVLHVVAVGGIYAFNSIKAHKLAIADATSHPVASATPVSGEKTAVKHDTQEVKTPAKTAPKPIAETAKVAETPHKKVDEPAKPQGHENAVAAKDSGQVYTVVHGDNPVIIAKKLHVSYDELLKLNKIEDPKKLQIGQKLRIPAKGKN